MSTSTLDIRCAGRETASGYSRIKTLTCRRICRSTPYNETCWNTLHVAEYILKWEQETPKCPPGNNTCIQTGCASNEPWSSCFLRLATGTPDYNCTQINIGHCTLEGFPLKNPNSTDMPIIRYAARNIFGMDSLGKPRQVADSTQQSTTFL